MDIPALLFWLGLILVIYGVVAVTMRDPSWWVGLGMAALAKAWPFLLPYLLLLFKRMDPVTEEAWRKCKQSGGKWNHMKKRCE